MRTVTKIPPRAGKANARPRVAAYARVSSGKDAMLHSLSAQISCYNEYISKRGDWEFAGIYADEVITGTKDCRPEFQRLLGDCRAGKIDMVITKSITRLARNTVTLLEVARELRLLGVDIFFEKENIHSNSGDGELMLSILASYAQEESRSASENQKWRIRKKFEQGCPHSFSMLGYRLVDGKLYVVPEEAKIVKQIFADYLFGMKPSTVVNKLNSFGIKTLNGNEWKIKAVMRILRNEKYTGNMLLQKSFRSDHITKRKIENHGEFSMYYVENSHEAIIPKIIFKAVQQKIASRAAKYQSKEPIDRKTWWTDERRQVARERQLTNKNRCLISYGLV